MITTEIKTSHGTFTATFSERGLAQLEFPSRGNARRKGNPLTRRDATLSPSDGERDGVRDFRRWHIATARALKQSLAGKTPKTLPPLDLNSGTEFQRRVWSALRKISSGKTRSYTEVASAIGKPKAARAVGSACGANPIPVLIPCHRVLAANKKLGGFSGGLNWKKSLLAREGIAPKD